MVIIKQLNKEIERAYKAFNSTETTFCHICGDPRCYELSYQEVNGKDTLVKNYFQSIDGFICADCYQFMVNTGKWFTFIQTNILKLKVLFKRKNAKRNRS